MQTHRRLACFGAAVLGLWPFVSSSVLAQTTPANVETEGPDEEVVLLSPFTVDASADKGYLVGNTLSGSRLRTDLSDVGSSVSVMNAEFLKDIGARDMQDALRYEVNSENENEVVYNDTEGTITGDGVSNRVRGLINAQVTRDFFNTYLKTDGYNTDRITISRGPNSILFGIGSPSGSIDTSLKRANMTKQSGVIALTFDHYGTQRYEFDYNLPLTRQWSVRFDLLEQDKRTFMEPEFDKESRQFITTTFQPSENTTLTINSEWIRDNRVHGRRHTAFDGVSNWIAAGKPLYDAFDQQWVDQSGNPVAMTGSFINGDFNREYIYSNNRPVPSSAWNGITLNAADQGLVAQGNQALFAGGDRARSYSGPTQNLLGLNNEALFPADLNFGGLANRVHLDANIVSAKLEQHIGKGLDVELAFNREDYQNDSAEFARGNFSILQADVNKYLTIHDSNGALLTDTDGNPVKILNPNAGRYMINSQEIGFDRGLVADSYRATASYSLDFREKNSWLGRHQLAAMFQRDDTESHNVKTRTKNLGSLIAGSNLWDDKNNINQVAYLDLPGDSDGSGQEFPGNWVSPQDAGLTWWRTITGPLQETAIHNRWTNDALLAVLNSRFDRVFGNDRLAITVGFRKDTQKVYDAPISVYDLDEATGVSNWPSVPLPTSPTQEESGNTSTLSVVYHTPLKGFSLSYSKSNNFTPQAKYHDFAGQPQSASKGTSTDYGVAYDTADGKFHVKVIRFDAQAKNQKEEDWFYWEPAWTAIWNMEWHIKDYVTNIYPTRNIDNSADLVGQLDPFVQSDREVPFRDRSSTGYELELIAQPIEGLNLRFTAAKSDAVDSHIAPDMLAYVERRMPVWNRYADLTASWFRTTDDYADPTLDDPVNLYWGDENPGRTNIYSVGYDPFTAPGGIARLEDLKALEGASTIRSRDTSMNLTADYDFREGRLRGFNVGGGARYRAAAAIGYLGKPTSNPDLPAGTLVSDLSRPVMGDAMLNLDLWVGYSRVFTVRSKEVRWSLNLYVWNANTGRGLQPGSVNLRGEVDRWIIKEPRTFSVTNSFAF